MSIMDSIHAMCIYFYSDATRTKAYGIIRYMSQLDLARS